MNISSVTGSEGHSPALGMTSDPAAVAGDGSVIAILKAHRASLATIAAAAIITGGVITAGRLDTAPAKATAAAPTYTEGTSVALSTDLGGAQRNLIAERSAVDRNGVGTNVSLGSRIGKTQALVTGTITTTAVTADQVVLTRTVGASDTFYVTYVTMAARLTTLSATASILGTMSLETPSGTKVITLDFTNPTTSEMQATTITFPEPISATAGAVVRCVTTPAATTSMLWRCNFGGYEK